MVEGEDLNGPVRDVARGVLDGHIVLSRDLAHKNHFPAIDVLQSISRVMPQIADNEHKQLAGDIRRLMASYQEAQDLINIGAYQQGSNPVIDKAISAQANIKKLLIQATHENISLEETMSLMKKCVG